MATLDRTFAAEFLKSVDNSAKHGIHILFNQYWEHMPSEVRDRIVAHFYGDPQLKAWVTERWFPEPYSFDDLGRLPSGSLGRAYHQHIVANNLNREIADGYATYHRSLEKSGVLDNMPEEMKYATLRGFQVHDFLHMLTGFDTTGGGEIALQSFGVAQTNSLYNSMWLSVTTTQAAFLHPQMNPGLMDAITEGWRLGRSVKTNLVTVKWEQRLHEQVSDLRREYGVPDHSMMLKLAA
jgi:ubiquinone biosynthesis protein Coq4